MADRISDSNVVDPKEHEGVFTEFLHSAAYAAVQEPIKGVSQLVDHVAGTNLEKNLTFISQPTGGSGTGDWIARQLGGAVGMILPYMLVRGGMKGLIGESAQTATTLGMSLKEAGMTGFAYQALLKPTEGNPDNNFWVSRGMNGAAGAATFMTMTGSAYGLGKLGNMAESSGMARVAPILRNPMAAGLLSGLPAGVVSAEGSSLINNDRFATGSEIGQSVASMALMAEVFGANEVVKAKYTDGQSIPRFVAGKINKVWSPSERAEQQAAPTERGSERPNLEISRNFAGSTSRQYQLVDKDVQVADLLRTSPEKYAYAPVREVKPSGELGPQQNLFIQHLDKGVPLDQVLAQKADLLATCNPQALPQPFLGKHIMPSAQEGLWLTQAAGGRLRFTAAPESAQSVKLGTAAGSGYRTVTETLLAPDTWARFRLEQYPPTIVDIADEMSHFKQPVARFIDGGKDSLVMEMADQSILKITTGPWDEEWGERTVETPNGHVLFDNQIIGQPESLDVEDGATYYLQRRARSPVAFADFKRFDEMIDWDGNYEFFDKGIDPRHLVGRRQLGYVLLSNGKMAVRLLDYDSVRYIPEPDDEESDAQPSESRVQRVKRFSSSAIDNHLEYLRSLRNGSVTADGSEPIDWGI